MSSYVKEYRNKMVLIDRSDKNIFTRSNEIIILKYGTDEMMKKKDSCNIIIRRNSNI